MKKIKKIEKAFHQVPNKILEMYRYGWGLNNSTKNLNKSFTYGSFVTFKSAAGRAVYLPHPAHCL